MIFNMNSLNEIVYRHADVEIALNLSVCVILKNITKYQQSSAMTCKLNSYCLNLLMNSAVTVNSTITLLDSKLARAYGICHIQINQCQTSRADNSASGLVTDKTSVHVEAWQSEDFYNLRKSRAPVSIGGYEDEVKQLSQLLLYTKVPLAFSYRPVGVLLHGPPGCGKSSLAKYLAYTCDAVFMSVEGTDLLSSEFGSGAAALRRKFKQAVELSSEGPVMLFLDEIDTLCPKNEKASIGNKQLTNAIIIEMDSLHDKNVSGLLVLAATNFISSVHSALRRPGRFDREVLINVPTREQRVSILKVFTNHKELHPDVSLEEVAACTVGYVGADLKAMCEEAVNLAHGTVYHDKHTAMDSEMVLKRSHFMQALHSVSPSLKKTSDCVVEYQPVSWNDIGGLDDVKVEIQQAIEWPLLYPDALRRMDLAPTKGVLLYGPPGCCKTTLVRAAATSCHVTFLTLNGAQVYSAYVGESERIISEAFQKARALSPAILFFDEIESLGGKRANASGKSNVQERILSTMLNEMDGVGTRLDTKMNASHVNDGEKGHQMTKGNVLPNEHIKEINKSSHIDNSQIIVIGATNRIDMLDSAILRPGRLDKLIYVPPPDLKSREAILKIQTSKMSTTDLDLESLSGMTEFFSGADLKNLCKEAGLIALRETMKEHCVDLSDLSVQHRHFLKAMEIVKPSLSRT